MPSKRSKVRELKKPAPFLELPIPPTDPGLAKSVKAIRKRFLTEYEDEKDLYYQQDVQRLTKSDFPIRRFLYATKFVENEAYEMMKDSLKWRKEQEIYELTTDRFPKEFYRIGALFTYEPDREGNSVLYIRFKVHRKLEIIADHIKKFLLHFMEKLDQVQNRERSWAVVFDAEGASAGNVDFDLLFYLVKAVKYNFPFALRYIAVHEVPWYLQGGWKIAMMMIPEESRRLFRAYNRSTITEVIAKENLPDFLGGTCKRDYREVPPEAKPAEEVAAAELGLSPEEVSKIRGHFAKYLPKEDEEEDAEEETES